MKKMTKERMIAVGAFIRAIRETGKAPAMSTCLKNAGYSNPAAELCRKMTAALKELKVFGTHRDGTAFLYKDNWDSVALMKDVNDLVKKIEAPAKEYNRKKTAMSDLVYDDRTGEFVPKGQEEAPTITPVKNETLQENYLAKFSDEELLAELQHREDERKAAEELAKKKVLVQEFLETWGLSLDDLLQIAEVIWWNPPSLSISSVISSWSLISIQQIRSYLMRRLWTSFYMEKDLSNPSKSIRICG